MSSYWDLTPKGIWQVKDYQDSLEALQDPESRADYDKSKHRITVFGPVGKAIIIELKDIEGKLQSGDVLTFHRDIYRLTGIQI